MAHTDRDDARWFWKNHFDWSKRDQEDTCEDFHQRYGMGYDCWCHDLVEARKWVHPYRYESGIPSYYHKDCRQEERAKARSMMQRARNGHIDWDDLVIGYKRPYYW